MEYHRQHSEERRGDAVLEVWSTADYIAQSVIEQHLVGDWAKMTDKLKRIDGNSGDMEFSGRTDYWIYVFNCR